MTFEALLATIASILEAHGYAPEVAAPIARTMAMSERDGTASHGLLRLPAYLESVRSGWADGRVLPEVVSRSPSMRVVDARNGFTHLALARSRDELQSMASATGCAVLLIRNAHHLAALWPDIEDFAAAGFVAFACVTSRARVTAWGGDKPVFGTNASAFACPRADGPPITWDQAASVMSHGDLMLAAREGRAVPEGVGVDAQGRPTSDAKAILDGGALSPFGGVKGASIAFMVEILASALSGSVFGFESPAAPGALPSKCGEFILLLDPRRASGAIGERVEALAQSVVAAGAPRLPGDRRHRLREAGLAGGIELTPASQAVLAKYSPPRN